MSVEPASPLTEMLGVNPSAVDVVALLLLMVVITSASIIVAYLAFAAVRDRMKSRKDEPSFDAFDDATDQAVNSWENHLDARREGWRTARTTSGHQAEKEGNE